MLSGETIPNRPSKGDPDDGRRIDRSKRWTKNTDEGCSKTKNLTLFKGVLQHFKMSVLSVFELNLNTCRRSP